MVATRVAGDVRSVNAGGLAARVPSADNSGMQHWHKRVVSAALLALAFVLPAALYPAADAETSFIGARGRLWTFQKVIRPAIPPVQDTWIANPIDAFLLAAMRAKQLDHSPALQKTALIRRVTFDLTGLPPAPEAVTAFVNDRSPDAYEKLVDKLMSSPAYGERLGMKWLDVVRYADTNGYEHDGDRPHAWRYRDYVISSFNTDKPYDRFIREQIAGDDAYPGNPEALIATGYLRAGSEHLTSGNIDPEESRQEVLTEIATSVGQTFLGMTVNCARCHNHKFDPILQADFYRLQAVFAGAKGKEVELVNAEEKAKWTAAQAAYKARLKPVEDALKALALPFETALKERRRAQLPADILAAENTPKEKRTPAQAAIVKDAEAQIQPTWDEVVAEMPAEIKAAREKLRETLHLIEATAPEPLPSAYAYVNTGEAAPQSYILRMGDPHDKLDPVEPAVPRVVKADFEIPRDAKGRRTALADWLASKENPLTARVMVNRLWQLRMGTGLVRTPNDFGVMGDKPESHALLDWLAAEFMDQNWSIKKLDRLIVTSSAYRQSADDNSAKAKLDPENRLYWRMNHKRLEAEMIRDAALLVSGTLNPQLGGRPVKLPLEPEVYDLIFTESERDGLWPVNPDKTVQHRRTVYLYNKRGVRLPLLSAFDEPDNITSCPVRPVSTHPLQALSLFNSPMMQETAGDFASRLEKACAKDRNCVVDTAWRLALGRVPRMEEKTLALRFLNTGGLLPDFALALFNRNEFLYVP